MAEKLLIVSDMWGAKKGLWITSYFAYLQQYYDIQFYDAQQLANIDVPVCTDENVHQAFVNGGIDTAVAHLTKCEGNEPAHVLAFSMGAAIAWKAGLNGMKMKSLTAISGTRLRYEDRKPKCQVNLLYGAKDEYRPKTKWFKEMGMAQTVIPNFGHSMYSDEKIIGDVCMDLLGKVTRQAG